MMKTAILASLVASAGAFAPSQNVGQSKAATVLKAEKSPAVPFL
eukprot:CAMPEP_0113513418 /NCGR_PEP_ID=MMETSP0014_2-20120614/39851_1 /TAXON_ID=2857 /ORGANISM="Nitzschia sp." /LENGTH=43 /DNA_ID=CAMNT_0000409819 /DNA_START=83 /DNA_END=211 /DNA_ORIENTATION=- /assembly_acc=CAM_ASM_000159